MKLSSGVAILLFGLVLLSACSSSTASLKLAPIETFPPIVRDAPDRVRTAYQFAVANPHALKNVPCTCGCQKLGHSSNYACFVREMNVDGTFDIETHGLGCGVCVSIAHDVMRMTGEGKADSVIRAYIYQKYAE